MGISAVISKIVESVDVIQSAQDQHGVGRKAALDSPENSGCLPGKLPKQAGSELFAGKTQEIDTAPRIGTEHHAPGLKFGSRVSQIGSGKGGTVVAHHQYPLETLPESRPDCPAQLLPERANMGNQIRREQHRETRCKGRLPDAPVQERQGAIIRVGAGR